MDHPVEHLKGYADGAVLFKKTRMANGYMPSEIHTWHVSKNRLTYFQPPKRINSILSVMTNFINVSDL